MCFQRAMTRRCGKPSFLSFTIRACVIRRLVRHHLLPGWSPGQPLTLSFLIVGLVMGPKRRRIESGKKLVFSVSEWQKCSRQFACHPEPFARFFVCAYAALHDVLSYAMTYSHKRHWYGTFFQVANLNPSAGSSIFQKQERWWRWSPTGLL